MVNSKLNKETSLIIYKFKIVTNIANYTDLLRLCVCVFIGV